MQATPARSVVCHVLVSQMVCCSGKGHSLTTATVLVVEDDPVASTAVTEFLRLEGYKVLQAHNLKTAHRLIEVEAPDVSVVDCSLRDGNALGFLSASQSANPGMKCIVLAGHGTFDLAIKAIKEGAEQFLL